MYRGVINVCGKIVRPLGNLMRDPKVNALAKSSKLPSADAAIAFAFAQRRDGSVNLPTQSIVKKTVQLHRVALAQKIIFFGSNHENNITEARAMAVKARELGAENEVVSEVAKPIAPADKNLDMALLGQELDRLNVKSSYIVAHPLHLWRARLLCETMFPHVTFYPIESDRIFDWGSNQLRCRAEIFFIPWNILAFIEHFIKGKI